MIQMENFRGIGVVGANANADAQHLQFDIASQRAQRPPTPSAMRLRLPSSGRTVTARLLRPRASDPHPRPRREVPEIRLSGAWLARVGFPNGRRYLISADRAFETIYLQADASKSTSRRRR